MSYADGSPVYLPQNLAPNEASPGWNNKADNAWQLTAATLVGMQSVPGLVILYGSMVKKKWAVNSAFMALYAFAAVLVCWVLWAHSMAFGDPLCPLMGKPHPMLSQHYLLNQLNFGSMPKSMPTADYVYFQFAFAAITVILLAGSLLGRMNFYAWMMFVPLWLTFSYTVGAFCIWGDGFLNQQDGIRTIDYAGGFVIHLSSGVAGFTAAYWVGPRLSHDRQNFPPNNIIHMLGGAGFLWLGWTGFNGGSPFVVSRIASLAILNTHLCTSTSLIVWVSLDMIFYRKSSVIGAVQGMMTGLVCITPGAVFQALYTLSGVDIIHRANYLVANLIIHFVLTSNIATAGVVDPWAAAFMGAMSGSVPWYTMMVLHRRSAFFQKVDDTLAVFHTHAVAGVLGGILSGLFAKPNLLRMFYFLDNYTGLLYGIINGKASQGLQQMLYQLAGVAFITVWNVVATSFICLLINRIVNLRMVEDELEVGDGAAHGEEAYALWGDGEKMPNPLRFRIPPRIPSICGRLP